jgi:ABC-2 type transport system permease protein
MMRNRQIWLVARQTFKTRVKSVGYWGIVLSPLLILGVILGVSAIIAVSQSNEAAKLGVVDNRAVTTYLKADKQIEAEVVNVASAAQAKPRLSAGKLDGYIDFAADKAVLTTKADSQPIDSTSLQAALSTLSVSSKAAQLGLTGSQLQNLLAPVTVKSVVQSEKGATNGEHASTANQALSGGLGVIIFVFLTMYVGIISSEIANEKTSRIMEILLAATSPAVQFFGKILGVGLLAILHAALYLVAIGVTVLVMPDNAVVKQATATLAGVDWKFALISVALVLVGIVLYMILTAIVAAMVNDQSQVQQAVAPVSYIALIGYIMSLVASTQPKNVLFDVMSYVPFVSQTLMPARLGLQFATTWQALIALFLEIVAVVLLGRYGLRVYRQNVLQYNASGNLTKAAFLSLKGLFKKATD